METSYNQHQPSHQDHGVSNHRQLGCLSKACASQHHSNYPAVRRFGAMHYCDVIMGTVTSQITRLTIVYSNVYSDADQRKHQSSASLVFVRGFHRGPVKSPPKWPVTRKTFPFDDVIIDMHLWSGMAHCRVWDNAFWICEIDLLAHDTPFCYFFLLTSGILSWILSRIIVYESNNSINKPNRVSASHAYAIFM